MDQLLNTLDKEFDEKKRLKIFKDLDWTLYNDVASVLLLFEARYVGTSDNVQVRPAEGLWLHGKRAQL